MFVFPSHDNDANIDVRIAGNNFANLPTTGVLNKQLFFTVKKFLSNDLQIENLSGSGTGVVVTGKQIGRAHV